MQTFAILKPDAIEQGLVLKIKNLLQENGFIIINEQLKPATLDMLEKHYDHIKDKPFFSHVVEYMTRQPYVLLLVLEKDKAVEDLRKLAGHTDPRKADPTTIRGKWGRVIGNSMENVIHASDSEESAKREIELWFD